ncbi:MAG TPA: exo-beta-N-acetylmuramidase NamZ domain-containing protein [Thermoanaerobaculia bacterium]|jgi:uncharacterized protein YbbC (DUF1343 family)
MLTALAFVLVHQIDQTIQNAIARDNIPGAVYHLERGGKVYEKAYGDRALVPRKERMTRDTIFDAASLTKVVATAPSIWLLIERGKVELDAPLNRYIAEARGDMTIRHLLTHTSGLRPDLDLREPWSGYETGIALAVKEEPVNRPGYVFRYSDINYELLGEVVRRVSGQPLDVFARREIFAPLHMRDTHFRPLSPLAGRGWREAPGEGRIAPTEFADGVMLRGVVHDPTARRMGGVAGHAGLFTTAADLAKFARMLLRGGAPIFKRSTVTAMTSVQSPPNVLVRRAGGFDIDSGYSRPRGTVFPLGSYGHTGFTGTILWIDPQSKTFYIFLSNRVHPNGKGVVTALQVSLGTLSAKAARVKPKDMLPPRPGGEVGWITRGADVANGIDNLIAKQYAPLRGMKIGVITNHTGIDRSGNPTVDLLRSAPGVDVRAIFAPEHGLFGAADANVGDMRDPVRGLPVYSLYGQSRKPKPEQLAGLDALVFDIQDVGARFYTYPATMQLAMEAAAEAHVKFIVLDRVNPINGAAVEGPLLHGAAEDFIGWHDVPIRHGMTMGELAKMFAEERHIGVDLTVIPLLRWMRAQWQDDAGLPWINTSPNMRSLTEATLYPGVGIVEFSVSVGRGTDTPFELVGAPYVDPERFVAELNTFKLPGIRFDPVRFTPMSSNFAKQQCGGAHLTVTDRNALQPVKTGIAIALALQKLYPKDFTFNGRLLRAPLKLDWSDDERAFRERRAKFLLYD